MPVEGLTTIDLSESEDVLPISSFIKSVHYLKLETNQKKIEVGEIEALKLIDNELIVKSGKAKEKSILRFSKDGNFLNEILGTQSKINDLVNANDFIGLNNEIAVLGESEIHLFSKSGKPLKKWGDFNFQANRFFTSNNRLYIFNETAELGYLSSFDINGKSQDGNKKSKAHKKLLDFASVMNLGSENFHLFSPLTDTVFRFSKNKLFPVYVFNSAHFPSYMNIADSLINRSEKEARRFVNTHQHVIVKNYLENANYIFITYWVGSSSSNVLINKKNWTSTYFKSAVNDIDGGVWENPVYLSEKDVLYIPVSSSKISNHKVLNKKKKGFKKFQEGFETGDNPVIMLCKLK